MAAQRGSVAKTTGGGTSDSTAAHQVETQALLGPVNEGTPANEAASAGLNGRLKRLAVLLGSIATLLVKGQGAAAASLSVVPASDALFQLGSISAVTDRSLNIAAGGTRQVLMASNGNRRGAFIQNASTAVESIWIREIAGNAGAAQPSIEIVPGTSITFDPGSYVPLTAIDVFAATTGHQITAREW